MDERSSRPCPTGITREKTIAGFAVREVRAVRAIVHLVALTLGAMPCALAAQDGPVSATVRSMAAESGAHLLAAAAAMPADRYAFKPTPAQMTFGELVVHIRRDDRSTCASVGGRAPAAEPDPAASGPKAQLVSALGRSIAFCDSALARLSDAQLGDSVTWYGHRTSRAAAALGLLTDWADHYGQAAVYLRLVGVLPPTAR